MFIKICFINFIKSFSFLMAVFLLVSCSSNGTIRLYDGTEKKQNEIVSMNLPASIDILEVDGKKVKSSLFGSDGDYQLQVLPGKHFLKAVYSEFWGTEKLGNMMDSSDFYFAVDAKAGSEYIFMHNGPKDLVNAPGSSSIDDIKIWIVDQNTGLKINPAGSQSYGGFVTGLMQNKEEDKKIENSSIDPNVTTQLKYWWKLANEKQREIFQEWIRLQQ